MTAASVLYILAAMAMAGIALVAARVVDRTVFSIARVAYTTLLSALFAWRVLELSGGPWPELVDVSLTLGINLIFPLVAAGDREHARISGTVGMVLACFVVSLPALLLLEMSGGLCVSEGVCLPATGVAQLYNIFLIVAVVFFILVQGGFGGAAAASGNDASATVSRRLLSLIFVAQVVDAGLSLGVNAMALPGIVDNTLRAGVAIALVYLVATLLLRVELRTAERGVPVIAGIAGPPADVSVAEIARDDVPDAETAFSVPGDIDAGAVPVLLALPAAPEPEEGGPLEEPVAEGAGLAGPSTVRHVDHALMERLRQLVEADKVFTTPGFGRQDLAELMKVSERHLTRFFSGCIGMPVNDYLNKFRIEHAKALLADGDKPVTEIAFDSGFNSLSSFYRCFKDATGLQPGQYRLEKRSLAEVVSLTSFARRS